LRAGAPGPRGAQRATLSEDLGRVGGCWRSGTAKSCRDAASDREGASHASGVGRTGSPRASV
jgi:hypothetical protein